MNKFTLYPHQIGAIALTCESETNATSYLLNHEMGLGKTLTSLHIALARAIQSLAELKSLDDYAPYTLNILVVCPKYLKPQWANALTSFISAQCADIEALSKMPKLYGILESEIKTQLKSITYSLHSYDSVKDSEQFKVQLKRTEDNSENIINFAIFDESHYLKKSSTRRFKLYLPELKTYVKKYSNIHALFLSGTPLKNHAGDMYPYAFINSTYPKGQYSFSCDFANQSTVYGGHVKFSGVNAKNAPTFSKILKPSTHTLKTKDCINLPEKIHIALTADASEHHDANLKKILSSKEFKTALEHEMEKRKERNSTASNTSSFSENNLEEFKAFDGTILKSPKQILDYSKVQQFYEQIVEIIESKQKVIIFCDYKTPLKYLYSLLTHDKSLQEKHKDAFIYVSGDTSDQDKVQACHYFNTPERLCVMLATTPSMSTGVNLQQGGASTMIFLGLPWGYAELDQAEARIHRIGQKLPCTYYKLMGGKYDEKIINLIEDKRKGSLIV